MLKYSFLLFVMYSHIQIYLWGLQVFE